MSQGLSAITLATLAVIAACSGSANHQADSSAVVDTRALLDQEWELAQLGLTEIPSAPPGMSPDAAGRDLVPGRRPTIRFSSDPARAEGRSFCNHYGSEYVLIGDTLRFGLTQSTLVGCEGPDSLETRFFRALAHTRRYEVDRTRLSLIAEDGTQLVFVPAAAGR